MIGRLLLMSVLICFGSAAHADEAKVVAPMSSIKIVAVEPDAAHPIYPGDTVNVKVKVDYEIFEPAGMVSLIIQKEDIGKAVPDALLGAAMKPVTQGKGTVELEKSIVVPQGKVIQIFTPLLIQGANQTNVVDRKLLDIKKRE